MQKATAKLRSTVFLRPMRFIGVPVEHGEDKEPEEYKRGEYICLGIGQVQIADFHIVGSDTYKVYKPHGEEAKHHGKATLQANYYYCS